MRLSPEGKFWLRVRLGGRKGSNMGVPGWTVYAMQGDEPVARSRKVSFGLGGVDSLRREGVAGTWPRLMRGQ